MGIGDEDLAEAARRGFFVLSCSGLGRAELLRATLRYDPSTPPSERAAQVYALLETRRESGPLAGQMRFSAHRA